MQGYQKDGTDPGRKREQEEIQISAGHIEKKTDDGDDERTGDILAHRQHAEGFPVMIVAIEDPDR